MTHKYVYSLLSTIKVLESENISWGYTSRQCSDVSLAREWTILSNPIDAAIPEAVYAKPLQGNVTYDKIFLIDSDIFWNPADFMRLYESTHDAISGVYKQSDGYTTTLYEKNKILIKSNEVLNRSEPFEIIGAGLGFMCIKSGVFENTPRPWFQHIVEEHPGPSLEIYSEDISFVQKAIKNGFKFYADPRVLVGHTKSFDLDWL